MQVWRNYRRNIEIVLLALFGALMAWAPMHTDGPFFALMPISFAGLLLLAAAAFEAFREAARTNTEMRVLKEHARLQREGIATD